MASTVLSKMCKSAYLVSPMGKKLHGFQSMVSCELLGGRHCGARDYGDGGTVGAVTWPYDEGARQLSLLGGCHEPYLGGCQSRVLSGGCDTLGGCIKNSTYPDVIGVFTGVKFGATVVWGICGQGSGCPRGCGVHARDSAEVNRCGAVVQTSEGVERDGSCFPAPEIFAWLPVLGIGGIPVLDGPAVHYHQSFGQGVVGEIGHSGGGGWIGVRDQIVFVVGTGQYE